MLLQRKQRNLRDGFTIIKIYAKSQTKVIDVLAMAKSIILPRLGKSAKIMANLHL